jgi:hypothetical protein
MLAFADRQIRQLSGGQQQRVFLARALAQDAQIYFMDEPFAGVDATTERAIVALLTELRKAGGEDGELDAFFEELGPFSEASRPSFRSLGKMGIVGRRALNKSKDEIRELRRVAKNAPATAKPLRQFLQTFSDRELSRDDDPRAASTAPPAPDPDAYKSGLGFTGSEAFLNYFFWQTLSINAFDDISHFLRVAAIEGHPTCAKYQTNPSVELQKECGSYTGPRQFGLQGNIADPTEDRDGIRATSKGERGRAKAEQAPLPGQPDNSKPRIVLPPELREALENLMKTGSGPKAPSSQALPPGSEEQLLDYLLAP